MFSFLVLYSNSLINYPSTRNSHWVNQHHQPWTSGMQRYATLNFLISTTICLHFSIWRPVYDYKLIVNNFDLAMERLCRMETSHSDVLKNAQKYASPLKPPQTPSTHLFLLSQKMNTSLYLLMRAWRHKQIHQNWAKCKNTISRLHMDSIYFHKKPFINRWTFVCFSATSDHTLVADTLH